MSIEKLDPRISHERKPYSIILNHVIQNIKDPLAGFIWTYLSSLPPDWIVVKEHLKNKFKISDKKMKSIFSYLSRSNLIANSQARLSSGKMGKNEIIVLCGEQFDCEEPFENQEHITARSKSTPPVITAGSKTAPAVIRPSGSGALHNKIKIKTKIRAKNKYTIFGKSKYQMPSNSHVELPWCSQVMHDMKTCPRSNPSPILQEYMQKNIGNY